MNLHKVESYPSHIREISKIRGEIRFINPFHQSGNFRRFRAFCGKNLPNSTRYLTTKKSAVRFRTALKILV